MPCHDTTACMMPSTLASQDIPCHVIARHTGSHQTSSHVLRFSYIKAYSICQKPCCLYYIPCILHHVSHFMFHTPFTMHHMLFIINQLLYNIILHTVCPGMNHIIPYHTRSYQISDQLM